MKQIAILWIMLILCPQILRALPGEFIISQHGTTVEFTLHLQSSGPAWLWNSEAGKVVYCAPYDQTFNGTDFRFDSPEDFNSAPNGAMPWGVMVFTITSSGNPTLTFTIDFRDENWSDYYVGGPDITLYINPPYGLGYLVPPTGDSVLVKNDTTINIWDAYHQTGGPQNGDLLPPVFLKNVVSSANAGGTMQINSTTYNSGDTALVAYGSMVVGTNNERFTNYLGSGTTYKHINWNQTAADDALSRALTVTSGNNQQFAYFSPVSSATIQAILFDTGGNLDSVQFRDPWYLESNGSQPNSWHSFASPFHPTGAYDQSTGGVFLNQNVNSGVYYTVRAPLTPTINGFSSNFLGWSYDTSKIALGSGGSTSGYDQKAVIFKSSSSPTVTANYKAALASGNSDVLEPNGQRRLSLAGDVAGCTAVYSSAGEIWSSNRTGLTGSWSADAELSAGNGNNTKPSLTNLSEYRYLVWERNSSGSNYDVYIRSNTGSSWGTTYSVGSTSGTEPLPVVGLGYDGDIFTDYSPLVMVAYQESGTGIRVKGTYNYGSSWYTNTLLTWSYNVSNFTLSNLEAVSEDPSYLTLSYTYSGYDYCIYVRDWYDYSWSGGVKVPSSDAVEYGFFGDQVTNASDNSQVMRYSGSTYDAWAQHQVYYDFTDYVDYYFTVCQERNSSGCWQTAAAYETSSPSPPTLAKVSSGNLIMMWSDGGTIYEAERVSGSWGSGSSVVSGDSPTLAVAGGGTPSATTYVYQKYSSPLYTINYPGSGLSKSASIRSHVYAGRTILLEDTLKGIMASIYVGVPKVGATELPLIAVNDTLLQLTPDNCLEYLASQTAQGSPSDSLSAQVSVSLRGKVDNSFVPSTALVLAGGSPDETVLSIGKGGKNLQRTVGGSSRRNVGFKITSNLPSLFGKNSTVTLVHVFRKVKPGALEKNAVAEGQIPTSLVLAQNYPNPFNPTTQISYGLPHDGYVALKVYDLLGREIAVLVRDSEQAGMHTVTFDAGRLPSGIYYARIEFDGHARVIKMSLVK